MRAPSVFEAWVWSLVCWGCMVVAGRAEDGVVAKGPAVRWRADSGQESRAVVELSGLASSLLDQWRRTPLAVEEWHRLLVVYADAVDPLVELDRPPMLGRYRVESDLVVFQPAYPLTPGLRYRAVFYPGGRSGAGEGREHRSQEAVWRVPEVGGPRTEVVEVYPRVEVVPENLLKFYVWFSQPMGRGRTYEHIRLRTAEGTSVSLPFLELDEELWNPEMTRLTLLVDPGRIKRGVRPLEEVGPSMEAGRQYVLVIDQAWRDAQGRPLARTYEKAFRVGPTDREAPDPSRWTVQAPKSGGKGALVVGFGEPMDAALALRCLRLMDPDGVPCDGTPTLGGGERSWAFVPRDRWRSGTYRVLVDPVLEDLAGNNPGKLFDVDVQERRVGVVGARSVDIPVVVR